ncbi:MAG: NAD-dependent protein deacylase [Candidatus Helarchaeota archaeon]
MTEDISEKIKTVAKWIVNSKYCIVLSGAGMSTESGIPDFRGPEGLWTKTGDDPMDLASIAAFENMAQGGANAGLQDMLMSLVQKLITARPNKGHKAVGKLYKKGYIKAVITQNIDNLHQRGGAKEVVEVHGTYKTATCMKCNKKYKFEQLMQMVLQDGKFPPTCDRVPCGGTIKPDVVFFGEMLPPIAIRKAMEYSQNTDLMLVLGSSLVVYPVANLPNIAKSNGAKLVIINDEETPKDHLADIIIRGKIGEIMPKIVEEIELIEQTKGV